jgi:hypothetical protein
MADSLVAGPNPQCSGRGRLDTIDLNGTDLGRRSGKMRAPKAPATERPEPLIGSCWVRSHEQLRTTAGRSGHRTFLRSANHSTYSPLTSDGGDGAVEFEFPHPAAVSPPGSCQEAWSPRVGLTPGRDWEPSPPRGSVVVLAGRATGVP